VIAAAVEAAPHALISISARGIPTSADGGTGSHSCGDPHAGEDEALEQNPDSDDHGDGEQTFEKLHFVLVPPEQVFHKKLIF